MYALTFFNEGRQKISFSSELKCNYLNLLGFGMLLEKKQQISITLTVN